MMSHKMYTFFFFRGYLTVHPSGKGKRPIVPSQDLFKSFIENRKKICSFQSYTSILNTSSSTIFILLLYRIEKKEKVCSHAHSFCHSPRGACRRSYPRTINGKKVVVFMHKGDIRLYHS